MIKNTTYLKLNSHMPARLIRLSSLLFFFCSIALHLSAQRTFEAGTYHSLFLCSSGTANSCGNNVNGALGDGTSGTDRISPVPVTGLMGVTVVSAGDFHSLFVKSDGTVWACGNNANGELGDGTFTTHTTPTQITSLSGVVAAAAGQGFSLFLKSDSTVWACGRNTYGQLGIGNTTDVQVPVKILTLTGVKDISVGRNHSLFLKGNGSVLACGQNFRGQLGNGNNQDKWTPVTMSASGVAQISAGGEHSLVLKSDGTPWACGYNLSGQLGNGTNTNTNVLIHVGGSVNSVSYVAGGGDHTLLCKSDGTVWGCGKNTYGALGDGTTADRNSLVQATGLTGMVKAAGGGYHSLFLKNDGTLWSCGGNFSGQLGDSTTTQRLTAVQVLNLCTPTGIEEAEIPKSYQLTLLNQPSSTELNAELYLAENAKLRFDIYNIEGRILDSGNLEGRVGSNVLKVDLHSFQSGLYFIRVFGDSITIEKKFAKI
jgi:alpha-tubulin suppressor-like RCC1 family protein